MPVSNTASSTASAQNGSTGFAVFPFAAPEALSSLARMNGSIFDAWMKCNCELMDFYRGRFEEDRRLAGQLAGTREPDKVLGAFAEFWQKAWSDYSGEVGKLATMNTEIAAETVRQVGDSASLAADGLKVARRAA